MCADNRRKDEKWEMIQLLVVSVMWEEEIKAEETFDLLTSVELIQVPDSHG